MFLSGFIFRVSPPWSFPRWVLSLKMEVVVKASQRWQRKMQASPIQVVRLEGGNSERRNLSRQSSYEWIFDFQCVDFQGRYPTCYTSDDNVKQKKCF